MAVILSIQAGWSILLSRSNTAFLDEATYLTAGHQLLYVLFHGGPNLYYSTYFSGAPDLYPVLVAVVDGVGGLSAARGLSTVFMLLSTVIVFKTTQRLFSDLAGVLAAAVFATAAGTQFIGSLATYDSLSVLLVATATWITVISATRPGPLPSSGIFLAVPVLVLANAVKYVSLEFDPIVVGLLFFLIAERHGYAVARRRSAMFLASTAALICACLAFSGTDLLTGAVLTTLRKQPSYVSRSTILLVSFEWVGFIAAIATVTLLVLLVKNRRSHWTSPALGIGLVLTVAIFVAPFNQYRADTAQSLAKHVTFGAWFGSILCGIMLAELIGSGRMKWLRVGAIGTGLLVMFAFGVHQSSVLFDEWPNATGLTNALRPYVDHSTAPVLIDDAQVVQYYLGSPGSAARWDTTFSIDLKTAGGKELNGDPAYRWAVQRGYFAVIALTYSSQIGVDSVVSAALQGNPHYRYIGKVSSTYAYGKSTFVMWYNPALVR